MRFLLLILCFQVQAASLEAISTDATPAFNAAVARVCASSTDRTLRLPAGQFVFHTAPAPIRCALNLIGEGQANTILIREYSLPLYFIKWVGGDDRNGAGGSIRDLSLDAGHFKGGIALWIEAQPETDPNVGSKNPHGLMLENFFVISGAYYPNQGNWAYGIYLDGSSNVTPPPGVAAGIRAIRMNFVSVGQFTILPYLLYYALGTRIQQADCWVPVGTGPNVIYIMYDQDSTLVAASNCPVMRP